MSWLWLAVWILSQSRMSQSEEPTKPMAASSLETDQDSDKDRSLHVQAREDNLLPSNSYLPAGYPYQAATYPPASYGPPNTEIPPGMVHLEFAFDEVVLRCITEEPYEHIIWTRYQCPQQYCFGAEGVHIADGSTVNEPRLYDVHIRGHDGTIISELLIKKPQEDASEGIYQCEAWPHIHGGGGGYSPAFGPYQAPYCPPKSNVFIIGGDALLENCYCNTFGNPLTGKIPGFTNKQMGNKDPKPKPNSFTIKPRRNVSSSQDSNSKQLRYNLSFDGNTIYNVDGKNVTSEFFVPSKRFDLTSPNHQNISKAAKLSSSSSNSFYEFFGRSNDRYRNLFPKFNVRRGKFSNSSSNSTVSPNEQKEEQPPLSKG